jgi:hypothetical protein
MPAWGAMLGPTAVQQVAAYVVTLRNTNVADGKAPQGEVWTPKAGLPAAPPDPATVDAGVLDATHSVTWVSPCCPWTRWTVA